MIWEKVIGTIRWGKPLRYTGLYDTTCTPNRNAVSKIDVPFLKFRLASNELVRNGTSEDILEKHRQDVRCILGCS